MKTTVGSGINKVRFKGKPVNMTSDHKVIIYGDSHTRGLSVRLKGKIPDSFEVTGYTKTKSNIQT
jgi:outer membrane receptor for monomeric catechols